MTLFDASAWTGLWPFTMSAQVGLDDLVVRLRAAGLSGAAVSPLNAVLAPEPMTANRFLLDAVSQVYASFPIRVVPVINPSLPGWEDDLALLEAADRVAAVKLVPNYHGYASDGREAIAAARAATAAGLGVGVQLRVIDERAHHPLIQVPGVPVEALARLATAVPDGRFLACGIFQAELGALADAPNVMAEVSSVESGDALANALSALGPDRLMLGTHAPVYDPAPGMAKVAGVTDDAGVVDRVGRTNAVGFFTRNGR